MSKILVAVSGGPDSMALLHMLLQKDFDLVVVHVNYNVRPDAMVDQNIVDNFCKTHSIPLEILSAERVANENFQAYARNVRYSFMQEVAQRYGIKEVYVAHHEDDVLETYVMQKERGSIPTYYGINEQSNYASLIIRRPLLKYSKTELLEYCHKNDIAYALDTSNFENDYTRNKIRNTYLSKLTMDEKKAMLEEIASLNADIHKFNQLVNEKYADFIDNNSIKTLLQLSDELIVGLLRMYFSEFNIHSLSNAEFNNIINFIKADGNGVYELNDVYSLSKAYDSLSIIEVAQAYNFIYNEVEYLAEKHFKICDEGKSTEAVTLSFDDFPITIRSFEAGDKIKLRFGEKRVSRFFVDRKIPQHLRKTWPIVLNAAGEVILVPGLGCNITHFSNNPTMFVVK